MAAGLRFGGGEEGFELAEGRRVQGWWKKRGFIWRWRRGEL
jgi:hypothetical protein